jgi:membrane protease YdiL (CAAX protease family)
MNASSNDSVVLLGPARELRPAVPLTEEPVAPSPPTARPSPGFWGSLGWLVVLIVVCQLIPGFVVGLVAGLKGDDLAQLLLPALFVGQWLGVAVAVVLLWRRVGRCWVSELGLNRLPLWGTLLAVLCVPGLRVAAMGISLLMKALFGAQDPGAAAVQHAALDLPWWLCLLGLAVGPALNEELWFRGFLGRGLVGRYGPTVGILLTSLLFGLAHLDLVQGLYAVILGLGLHLMYRATRSLWVPIVVHFVFNAVAVVTVFLAGGAAQEELGATEAVVLLLLGAVAVVMMAAAGWGLYRLRPRDVGIAQAS